MALDAAGVAWAELAEASVATVEVWAARLPDAPPWSGPAIAVLG
jgi:hypothetical protein